MSRDHYRDMYSARREGSLEPGLAGVFDETLRTDDDLREEYEGFSVLWESLDEGARESIETPEWLSARVLDRLDALPATASERGGLFGIGGLTLRSLGLVGLGAVAILGATFAVLRGSDGGVAAAGVASGETIVRASAGDVLRPVVENGRVYVDLQAVGPHDVAIFDGPEGAALQRYRVTDQRLHAELANPNPEPFAFDVRVDRQENPLIVVVPGTARNLEAASGSGNLILFAKALAQTYGTPVAVRVAAPKTAITWRLAGAPGQSSSAQSEALRAVAGTGLSVDTMPGGLLSIQDR